MGWYHGNVEQDAGENRSWMVGHFKTPGDVRHDPDVEIKVSAHRAGEVRERWATGETRRSFVLVTAGRWEQEVMDEQSGETERVVLGPGDYLVWDRRVAHTYRALEDSTVVTVRWPSVDIEADQDLSAHLAV